MIRQLKVFYLHFNSRQMSNAVFADRPIRAFGFIKSTKVHVTHFNEENDAQASPNVRVVIHLTIIRVGGKAINSRLRSIKHVCSIY